MSGSLAVLLGLLVMTAGIGLSWWTFAQTRLIWQHRFAVSAVMTMAQMTERIEEVEVKSRILERQIQELKEQIARLERLLDA